MKIKGKDDHLTYDDVKELCRTYISNEESLALIDKAYEYIMVKHAGQTRKSGEPYTIHLIWVAYILATLQTGPKTITAGLLHDVMEDCDVSSQEMINLFGEEITSLVEGVTKINKMLFKDEEDVYAENHRKIYIAMAKDIRVILIKLSDRLHNMRTLQYMRPDKQQRISRETLEVYAPIAHRLGINDMRIELEDLCLFYLDPAAYKEIAELLETKRSERKASVEKMMKAVRNLLDEHHIEYRIKGRAKHIYSIYKKMVIKHKRFDELYDLNALRIIVNDKMKCYEVLGIIHDCFRPLPGRFKDYIAMPKPNMYQSLHTAVIGEDGHIFEIQIRTEKMDELAAKEYYDSLRRDIFEANVYILTPQGKIVELPNGATPIDFAYRIHTEVGHHAVGAIVNNVMVPINTKLKTGDICEIKTNKNSVGPSEDWLKFVRTASARNKIRQFIAKRDAENEKSFIEEGRKLLEKVCPSKTGFFDNLSKMLKKNNNALNNQRKNSSVGITVNGMNGLKTQISKCCNPIPGDKIIGYISKGQGIKVHRADCPNILNIDKGRIIDVYWDYTNITERRFEVEIEIIGLDRPNLLNDVMTVLSQVKVNILNINANIEDVDANIKMRLSVENAEVLQITIDNLNKIQGVYEIKRIIH